MYFHKGWNWIKTFSSFSDLPIKELHDLNSKSISKFWIDFETFSPKFLLQALHWTCVFITVRHQERACQINFLIRRTFLKDAILSFKMLSMILCIVSPILVQLFMYSWKKTLLRKFPQMNYKTWTLNECQKEKISLPAIGDGGNSV